VKSTTRFVLTQKGFDFCVYNMLLVRFLVLFGATTVLPEAVAGDFGVSVRLKLGPVFSLPRDDDDHDGHGPRASTNCED
jgi:hypothetical protein